MTHQHSIERVPQFVADIETYFSYLSKFDENVAVKHYRRLEDALLEIPVAPFRHAYFKETGPPYRAQLFRVGKKTFWIIYTIDRDIVSLRRFWDCAQQQGTHWLR